MADAEVGATRWHVASVAVWTSRGPCPRDAHLRRSRSGLRATWTLPSSGFPPGGDGRSLLRPPPRLPLPRRRPPPETPRPLAAGRSLLLSLLCWTPPSWPTRPSAWGSAPRPVVSQSGSTLTGSRAVTAVLSAQPGATPEPRVSAWGREDPPPPPALPDSETETSFPPASSRVGPGAARSQTHGPTGIARHGSKY